MFTLSEQLQSSLLAALRPCRRPAAPTPRKKTMSSRTRDLVLQKREARRHLAAAFRHLGRRVVQALRHDDLLFLQTLLAEGADLLEPADVRRFWAVIRRSLPCFKQRKAHPAPTRIEALEDQLVPYLCELELGEPIEEQDLLLQCHQRQLAMMLGLPTEAIAASDLPTLTAFETSLRTTTPNRATGLDLVPAGVHHEHASIIARLHYSLFDRSRQLSRNTSPGFYCQRHPQPDQNYSDEAT